MPNSLREKLLAAVAFPFLKYEKHAIRNAEGWADFARLDEDEKEEVADEYLDIARRENARLTPLLTRLIDAACALETPIGKPGGDWMPLSEVTLESRKALAALERAVGEENV